MDFLTVFFGRHKINFCPNTPIHFLEKSKFKVESLMCRNTCDALYEVCWPQKDVLRLHLLYLMPEAQNER